jgi:Flp pilus assembly protein TadD
VLAATGQSQEARAEFLETLRIEPAHAGAHNSLGVLLASSGDLRGAIAEFKTALQLQPGYAEAKANLERAEALTKARTRTSSTR